MTDWSCDFWSTQIFWIVRNSQGTSQYWSTFWRNIFLANDFVNFKNTEGNKSSKNILKKVLNLIIWISRWTFLRTRKKFEENFFSFLTKSAKEPFVEAGIKWSRILVRDRSKMVHYKTVHADEQINSNITVSGFGVIKSQPETREYVQVSLHHTYLWLRSSGTPVYICVLRAASRMPLSQNTPCHTTTNQPTNRLSNAVLRKREMKKCNEIKL